MVLQAGRSQLQSPSSRTCPLQLCLKPCRGEVPGDPSWALWGHVPRGTVPCQQVARCTSVYLRTKTRTPHQPVLSPASGVWVAQNTAAEGHSSRRRPWKLGVCPTGQCLHPIGEILNITSCLLLSPSQGAFRTVLFIFISLSPNMGHATLHRTVRKQVWCQNENVCSTPGSTQAGPRLRDYCERALRQN